MSEGLPFDNLTIPGKGDTPKNTNPQGMHIPWDAVCAKARVKQPIER